MRSRQQLGAFLAVIATTMQLISISIAQTEPAARQDADNERVNQLLEATVLGRPIDEQDFADLEPTLVRMIGRNQSAEPEVLIHALRQLKPKSDSAVKVLCLRLDDPRHSVRAATVKALVAIGDKAITPVEPVTHSTSGAARAASLAVLGELKQLTADELERSVNDPDVRVRVVAARLLAKCDRRGIALLAGLLRDEEVAVAIEAANSMRINHSNPSLSILTLKEAVKRPILGFAAADALASFGTDARRAIPALIKAYRLGAQNRHFFSDDAVEHALRHIGPPDPADLPALCELLKEQNEELLIVLARTIGLLGKDGRAAVPELVAAAEATSKRAEEMMRNWKPDDDHHRANRVAAAAEEIGAAVWHVTYDAELYVDWIENEEIPAGQEQFFSEIDSSSALSQDHLDLLERLLYSPLAEFRRLGNRAINVGRSEGEPVKGLLMARLRDPNPDSRKQAARILEAVGVPISNDDPDQIMKLFDEGRITTKDLAIAVDQYKFHAEPVLKVLSMGLISDDIETSFACAKALEGSSGDLAGAASLVIQHIDQSSDTDFSHRRAISILVKMPRAAKIVVPYLIRRTSSTDEWARYEAIEALGQFGAAASSALDIIQQSVNDKSPIARLQAAISIFEIQGDRTVLDKELRSSITGEDSMARHLAFKAITKLGPDGATHLHFVIDEVDRRYPEVDSWLMDALVAIGNPEAIAKLEYLADSKIWDLQLRAKSALARVRKTAAGKGQ